ncbi:nuclear transport factor 2 family protein [Piscinibacter koreensis]|uniref:Nuclear transport factor 2 family protein n=1 Tax=Piscinibacter koreensis TaxID=2742824 RepID=A0A7Y6NQD7_9BURK|nr:nuclear transport factor 2 family protein [Schlegelella koreensis]
MWSDQRRALLAAAALPLAGAAGAQSVKLPADAVDGFHAALKRKDTAGALSHLDRSLVVFEFGKMDATIEAYALSHLPGDIDMAAVTDWKLQARRLGGSGDERWVLSTYQVTGKRPDGKPIDQTMLETAIVRRAGDGFRIVHLHWSSDKSDLQNWGQPRP